MKSVNIYPGRDGWFYEVWMADRVLVVGWSRTRDRAETEAAITCRPPWRVSSVRPHRARSARLGGEVLHRNASGV
jgi:hypothetical protein